MNSFVGISVIRLKQGRCFIYEDKRNAKFRDNLLHVINDHYSWYKGNVYVSSTSDNMPILYFSAILCR